MNINDEVWVELSEYGESIWAKTWTETGLFAFVPDSIRSSRTEVNGRIRFPLWDLMHTFGPIMYMGNEKMPFVNNEIYLSKD